MNLQVIEQNGQRLLTTKQIAEVYETDAKTVQYNFRYNKRKYQKGKHYVELTGEALKELKTRNEFQSSLKYAKQIYLWTERGALLHAKSINTDKAWEAYEWLVDFYFRARNEDAVPAKQEEMRIDIASNYAFQSKLKELDEYCITIRCIIKEFGAYSIPSKIAGMSYAIYRTGVTITNEAYDLKKLALGEEKR